MNRKNSASTIAVIFPATLPSPMLTTEATLVTVGAAFLAVPRGTLLHCNALGWRERTQRKFVAFDPASDDLG